MANMVVSKKIELKCDEAIARSVQFFSNQRWRCQSQSEKIATFQGKPPIPWFLILMTLIAFLFFIVPGIIMYIFVIRKVYRFQNLVVTTKSISEGCEIDINYPKHAKKLVNRFIKSLSTVEGEVYALSAAGNQLNL